MARQDTRPRPTVTEHDVVEVIDADPASAPAATVGDPAVGAGEAGDDYQQRLGARLRAVRRARGLRLQDVEEQSDGRFKAVVVGSYERGDRAVSAHKLAALASFYGVPVIDLLPDDDWPRDAPRSRTLKLSVDRLRRVEDASLAPLRRLVRHVQWLRGDYNGHVLSLREDDLRTVAIALGLELEELEVRLDEQGLLAA